jgi:hypothetical protein
MMFISNLFRFPKALVIPATLCFLSLANSQSEARASDVEMETRIEEPVVDGKIYFFDNLNDTISINLATHNFVTISFLPGPNDIVYGPLTKRIDSSSVTESIIQHNGTVRYDHSYAVSRGIGTYSVSADASVVFVQGPSGASDTVTRTYHVALRPAPR